MLNIIARMTKALRPAEPPSPGVGLSRRELLNPRAWFRQEPPPHERPEPASGDLVAHISIRDCLVYQGTPCSACGERCPVPGAISLDQGRPTVVAAVCIGCTACQEVCPAPRTAIHRIPRR